MYIALITAIVSLLAGNFLYEEIRKLSGREADWGRAADRSFFQVVAILLYAVLIGDLFQFRNLL
jgi:formate hydrogenlyase subunit 3/multisubunit Na+/H+ antiporter MnhD subunit